MSSPSLPLARAAAAALCLFASVAAPAQQPAFRSDPAFLREVGQARAGQTPADQIAHWNAAASLSGNACAECFERLATLNFRIGQWEPAISAARQFEQLSSLPADQAYAELLHGSALFHLNGDQPTPNELTEADTAFKAAILHDPTLRTALYLDGRALAALRRDDEAREVFTRFIEIAPANDPYRPRAQNYLANLSLARSTMAPPFAATLADGKPLTLADLHGRVVLLDFWATWCVPCRQLLPKLQSLAQQFADEPFTLLSISWDEDHDAWSTFVSGNRMTWPQVLDTDRKLSNTYGVESLPHYFTIDADGALQSEVIGVGDDDIEARLRKLIEKANREAHPRRKLLVP
jgi:thiol-disulfide isomerase/thioredoxin